MSHFSGDIADGFKSADYQINAANDHIKDAAAAEKTTDKIDYLNNAKTNLKIAKNALKELGESYPNDQSPTRSLLELDIKIKVLNIEIDALDIEINDAYAQAKSQLSSKEKLQFLFCRLSPDRNVRAAMSLLRDDSPSLENLKAVKENIKRPQALIKRVEAKIAQLEAKAARQELDAKAARQEQEATAAREELERIQSPPPLDENARHLKGLKERYIELKDDIRTHRGGVNNLTTVIEKHETKIQEMHEQGGFNQNKVGWFNSVEYQEKRLADIKEHKDQMQLDLSELENQRKQLESEILELQKQTKSE